MTYREAQLIKRTAWMNTRLLERGPRPEDEKYVPLAIRMLTLVASLNYAMLDLETALADAGMFRHETKRRTAQARHLVEAAHGTAYDMLRKVNVTAARQYNDKLDETYERIVGCVLLSEPDKSFNIVLSLCRLVEKFNGQISGRYDFNPAKPLYRIPAMLGCVDIPDRRIDDIIELNTK